MNSHSVERYGYEIFNVANFTLCVLGYTALFFGRSWYDDAIRLHEDILNGELLMGIGVLLLLLVAYLIIKRTSVVYGIVMSIVTGLFYAIATPFVVIALVVMVAYFSQTKPVINVN
jgi:hypothetical protein